MPIKIDQESGEEDDSDSDLDVDEDAVENQVSHYDKLQAVLLCEDAGGFMWSSVAKL